MPFLQYILKNDNIFFVNNKLVFNWSSEQVKQDQMVTSWIALKFDETCFEIFEVYSCAVYFDQLSGAAHREASQNTQHSCNSTCVTPKSNDKKLTHHNIDNSAYKGPSTYKETFLDWTKVSVFAC